MKPLTRIQFFLFASLTTALSTISVSATSAYWDFENAQRWIGDSAEGNVGYCSEKSIRWTSPQLGFDINQDSVDDFMMPIGCYQGEAVDGAKHNLKVRAAWKMYCSNERKHYDCTLELFGSEVIEATAVVGVDLNSKGMAMPQKFGAASSYAKKYAYGNLLMIDDTADDDATNKGDHTPPKKEWSNDF